MMHLKGYFSSRRRAAFSPLCITTIMAARRPSRILKALPTSWLLSHCASSPKISIPSCAKKTLLLMQPTLIFPMVLIMGAMVLLWRTEKKETICRWASAMLVASFFTLMTYFGDTTKFLMLKSWCYVIWVWMGLWYYSLVKVVHLWAKMSWWLAESCSSTAIDDDDNASKQCSPLKKKKNQGYGTLLMPKIQASRFGNM